MQPLSILRRTSLRPAFLAFEALAVTGALFFATVACKKGTPSSTTTGTPGVIPYDKMSYTGVWRGDGVLFKFTKAGAISFEKKTPGTSKNYSGKFKNFKGNDIQIDALVTTIDLAVQVPPMQLGGDWKMTIEGVEVTRVGEDEGALNSREREVEGKLRTSIEAKGIHVIKMDCPASAEHADEFICTMTEEDGHQVHIATTIKNGNIDYKSLDAALLDPKVLEAGIQGNMAGKGIRSTVDCSNGKYLLKPVGAKFICDAIDTRTRKKIPVTVTVKDIRGNCDYSYKW